MTLYELKDRLKKMQEILFLISDKINIFPALPATPADIKEKPSCLMEELNYLIDSHKKIIASIQDRIQNLLG